MAKTDSQLMQEIVELVRTGISFTGACEELGIRRDVELRSLRRRYKEFDHQLKQLAIGNKRIERGEKLVKLEDGLGVELDDPYLKAFVEHYADSNDKSAASRASNLQLSSVLKMLDPTHDHFHAELARAVEEVDLITAERVRAGLLEKALEGDPITARWWAERKLGDFAAKAKSGTERNDNKMNTDTLQKTMEGLREILTKIRKDMGNQNAGVAQSEEQGSRKATVAGSTPVIGSTEPDDTTVAN